jgi:antitoxin component YwqK of YwqJK toxin-antitoxin module
MTGEGQSYWDNGNIEYEGIFLNGLKECLDKKGYYYFKDGTLQYCGYWIGNRRTGQGVAFYDNQQILYEGEWKDDEWNGTGKRYSKAGDFISEGVWEMGRLAQDFRHTPIK